MASTSQAVALPPPSGQGLLEILPWVNGCALQVGQLEDWVASQPIQDSGMKAVTQVSLPFPLLESSPICLCWPRHITIVTLSDSSQNVTIRVTHQTHLADHLI
jgi:hypothetical protein